MSPKNDSMAPVVAWGMIITGFAGAFYFLFLSNTSITTIGGPVENLGLLFRSLGGLLACLAVFLSGVLVLVGSWISAQVKR